MNTRIRTLLHSGLPLAVLLTASAPVGAGEIDFEFDPANFTPGAAIDNQYLPMIAGSVFVYNSESGDGCAVNEIRVTGNTKDDFAAPYESILAWEVEDREWLDSECAGNYSLVERTKDWFAQDHDGNVWYFGEDTTAWDDEDECPSTAGAWQAGDEGAEAGVVMPANPIIGSWFQQELLEGVAEDRAKILRLNATVSIGLGTFTGCLRTKEYTPLSPGAIEHKHYCPVGGGLLQIDELSGGKTVRVELIGNTLPAGTFATDGVCKP